MPKYNKYVYLVFGDWVLTSCSFLSSVHFVFLSIFETPSIDGVTKVSHNVVIFLLIQITLSSFYLVTNYYFAEANFIWWLWDLIFVKTSCRGHYITSYFTGNNFISLLSSIYISNMCHVVIFKTEVITTIPT